jgi:hypothetical protein
VRADREARAVTEQKRPLVYVAGPYSKPDQCVNVSAACRAADSVLRAGAVPFVPHLTHLWHMLSPKEYELWMQYDFAVIRHCQALLRIPGESPGADREVAFAHDVGVPVCVGVDAILRFIRRLQLPPWLL